MIKKPFLVFSISLIIVMISGCAHNTVGTPCPNYGRHCSKTPINSWNINQ